MKIPVFTFILLLAVALRASAETEFPDYDSLTAAQKAAWGYTVHEFIGKNSSLRVVIPAGKAALYQGARLYLRDRKKNPIGQINAGLEPAADGSLSITITLSPDIAEIDLIIYTKEPPGALPVYPGGFGGFTFVITTKP